MIKSLRKKLQIIFFLVLTVSCSKSVDITPYKVNSEADSLYRIAVSLASRLDSLEPAYRSIELLDRAIKIDSLNPDYYGLKARLLLELGELDKALEVQEGAVKINAINGEYWFQLGLLQAASLDSINSKKSFKRSIEYFDEVLRHYPDSFSAYQLREVANSLFLGNDSVYMPDYKKVEQMFPNNLMDIEVGRRLKPSRLVEEVMFIGTAQIKE